MEFQDWRVVGVSTAQVNGKVVDWGVQVLQEGPYKDIVLIFGEMNIEDADDGTNEGLFTFDFDIFSSADKEIDINDPELQKLAGDILIETFTKALDEGKAVLDDGKPKSDNTSITLN
tara:strand:+ start:1333 stop:1683 length:351 start_codon:yes stop_codon:yes gene_type:complete